MSEIDVSKCEYKGGIECHIRDYPILNCADVKIEDCHYKQLQQLKYRLDSYEKDGGALDEGQAWANEAMASRDEISKLNKCLDEIKQICEENMNTPQYKGICESIKSVYLALKEGV